MTILLLLACAQCILVFVIGAAAFSDDLARWQWRLYGLLAATAAGFGLVAIHRYGQAHGYW